MTVIYKGVFASNMHGHLRLDDMLATTAPTASTFNYYYTAMGNHRGWPTSTPERAMQYRSMIRERAPGLHANVPCYIQEDTSPIIIREGFQRKAWIASKFMPRGVTTNSEEGVRPDHMRDLYPAYEMHEELGMLALFHGMRPHDPLGREVGWFDQERRFIDNLGELLIRCPKLKMVCEHITTREMASFVRYCQKHGYNVEATIAPQYLLYNTNWLFDGGMNPGNYSIPPIQSESDREALLDFIALGYGFRGNDSAPHSKDKKEQYCGCAGGIYSEAFGLDIIAYYMAFKEAEALDKYEAFIALKGPAFYGLKPTPKRLWMQIIEEEWVVPQHVTCNDGTLIVPLLAGETLPYSVHTSRM